MTVKAIRLENFMAFADTGWIELRPITLLFGRNSSGKSTIIRALRLLRQNLDNPTDDRYTLRFASDYGVELGGYKETVHGKDIERVMRFHFRCDVPETADAMRHEINQWRQQNSLPAIVASKEDTLTLALAFGYDAHREAELIGIELSCNWQITAEANTHTLLSALKLDQVSRYELGYEWRLDTDLPGWQGLDWQDTNVHFPINFLPQLIDSPVPVLEMVPGGLGQSVTTFLKGIEYIGPMRPEPKRVYVLDEVGRQRQRQQGWDAFVDFLEGNKLDDAMLTKVDSWLRALDLGERIEPPTQHSSKDATVASIIIKEGETEFLVNLKNTGFGASQVLPIIIQSVTARQRVERKTAVYVIIEQPELHLHPRAQAQLADLFIEEIFASWTDANSSSGSSRSSVNQTLSQVHFILETHSEHLILRLQRRLRKTKLNILHVYVAYTTRNKEESCSYLHYLRIAEDGEFLDYWPEGFFAERRTELFDLEEPEESL